jgi:hypothetical protein
MFSESKPMGKRLIQRRAYGRDAHVGFLEPHFANAAA